MAITSDTWWSVICDVCGESVAETDGMTALAESEKDAREFVSEYGGEIQQDGTPEGRIVCSTCLEETRSETQGGDDGD